MTSDKRQAVGAARGEMPSVASHGPAASSRGADPRAPALPDPSRIALFLDLDGTLLDLAPTPDGVRAEVGLADMLAKLERHAAGALALVTGRPIAFVDALFAPHRFSVAGLHGAEFRPAAAYRTALEGIPRATAGGDAAAFGTARDHAGRQAASLDGTVFEDKGGAFALHYRLAPRHAAAVLHVMERAALVAGPGYGLRHGKCVVELCPAGADKGTALRNLMASQPFMGRYPVAAGDDLTDEAMFRAVNGMGGLSIRIGAGRTAASARIATPGAFRTWLRSLAEAACPGE